MDHVPSITKIFSYMTQQEREILGNNVNVNFDSKIIITVATNDAIGNSSNCYDKKHGFPTN